MQNHLGPVKNMPLIWEDIWNLDIALSGFKWLIRWWKQGQILPHIKWIRVGHCPWIWFQLFSIIRDFTAKILQRLITSCFKRWDMSHNHGSSGCVWVLGNSTYRSVLLSYKCKTKADILCIYYVANMCMRSMLFQHVLQRVFFVQ